MESKQLSLPHLIEFPASVQNHDLDSHYPTILALHGRGSNEGDLIGLAPHLPQGLLWISPRAPLLLGPSSYEWYRVREIGKPDQVLAALETIDHFVDEILTTYPIDSQKLFLLGFSQGSILSMCYTLMKPACIAGVIAQSGYIPNGIEIEIDAAGVKGKPFLITHGEQDTLIPIEWSRASRDHLQGLGADVEFHEFPMGHQVSTESLAVIYKWLEMYL
jgi:phospholipase/carboxylesterase